MSVVAVRLLPVGGMSNTLCRHNYPTNEVLRMIHTIMADKDYSFCFCFKRQFAQKVAYRKNRNNWALR